MDTIPSFAATFTRNAGGIDPADIRMDLGHIDIVPLMRGAPILKEIGDALTAGGIAFAYGTQKAFLHFLCDKGVAEGTRPLRNPIASFKLEMSKIGAPLRFDIFRERMRFRLDDGVDSRPAILKANAMLNLMGEAMRQQKIGFVPESDTQQDHDKGFWKALWIAPHIG